MAAVKGIYGAGKSSGMHNNGISHGSGKRTPSTFSKVGASAGKNSGTARNGDANGCAPMGKGK